MWQTTYWGPKVQSLIDNQNIIGSHRVTVGNCARIFQENKQGQFVCSSIGYWRPPDQRSEVPIVAFIQNNRVSYTFTFLLSERTKKLGNLLRVRKKEKSGHQATRLFLLSRWAAEQFRVLLRTNLRQQSRTTTVGGGRPEEEEGKKKNKITK